MKKTNHIKALLSRAVILTALALLPVAGNNVRAQRIMWHKVPTEVQESFRLAHPALPRMNSVRWDWTDVGYCARFNPSYKEVSSLFQENGEWVSTRWVVPEEQLPLAAHDFISAKYAFYSLRSCKYEEDRWQGRHYYALFSIRGIDGYMTEVCFDMQGNVVSIDGRTEEDWDEFEPLNEEEVLLLLANQSLQEDMMDEETYEESEDGEAVDLDGDGIKELPIGFFAWKQDYDAMQRHHREQQLLKIRQRQEKRAETAERWQWLTGLFKKKTPEPTKDSLAEAEWREDLAQEQELDFSKEKEKQTKRIYKPQSRKDFSYVQVLNQSKAARKKQKEEKALLTDGAKEQGSGPEARTPYGVQVSGPATPNDERSKSSISSEPEQEQAQEPEVRIAGMQSSLQITAPAPTIGFSVKTIFPDHIQQAFNKRFPKAENPKYYHDTNGDYRAVFVNFGQKAEAVFLQDGTHITTALFFGKKEISYPIQQYIESRPEKLKFTIGKRIVYESRYRGRFAGPDKPQNYFEVVVWRKNKEDKSRIYSLLRFDHKGHFVSSTPYEYVGTR